MTSLFLFGAGEIAETIYDYLTFDSPYTVTAFCVDGAFLKETSFKGRPVIPFEEIALALPPENHHFLTAMGYLNRNQYRQEKYQALKRLGYEGATYIHSKAHVWPSAQVGQDVVIMEQNVIQPYACIGQNVTIWSGNHIGHHVQIGDHCFIASHAVISGQISLGPRCFVGVNATLRDNITVGEMSIIGAGALVLGDLPPYAKVRGLACEVEIKEPTC
jgi:sugar O-acyltransferase (sialic acid O-acetyltransferase NeuD family)